MKQYLYEMHAHTSEVSPCSTVPADVMVKTYIESGYSGIVITNHFSRHIFNRGSDYPSYDASWKEKVDYFLTGYQKAKEAAPADFTVLLGMEIAFLENDNDYLVYGLDENFLYENENLLEMGIKKFSELAHEHGLVVYQAHPFRDRMRVTIPTLLDGVEVHNGHPRHDSRNDIALHWAKKFGLKMVSGTDCHVLGEHARGGIIVPERILDNQQLLAALDGEFAMIMKNI